MLRTWSEAQVGIRFVSPYVQGTSWQGLDTGRSAWDNSSLSLYCVLDAGDECLQLGQCHVGSGQQGPGEASLRSLEARDFWRDVGTRPRKESGGVVWESALSGLAAALWTSHNFSGSNLPHFFILLSSRKSLPTTGSIGSSGIELTFRSCPELGWSGQGFLPPRLLVIRWGLSSGRGYDLGEVTFSSAEGNFGERLSWELSAANTPSREASKCLSPQNENLGSHHGIYHIISLRVKAKSITTAYKTLMICPHILISITYPSPILSLFLSASATQASLLLLKHTRHTYTLDPGALGTCRSSCLGCSFGFTHVLLLHLL